MRNLHPTSERREIAQGQSPAPLLMAAIDAHGGRARWHELKGVASTIVVGGMLWQLKGVEMDRTPRRTTTEFHRQWTQQTPFGKPDCVMTWTPACAEIVAGDGRLFARRSDGRKAFDRSLEGQWDLLNLAYFNGYAMWTYHAAPFVLAEPGYLSREIPAVEHEGETLSGVSVRFPSSVHTHTREQSFYFDGKGMLRRHDYELDVSANAPAAHFVSDYVLAGGLKFPTRRSVYARNPDGTVNFELNLVTIELSEYTVF